jgi:hypothetical protein
MRAAGVLLGLVMVVAAAFCVHRLLGAGSLALGGVLVMVAAAIAQPPTKGGPDGRA